MSHKLRTTMIFLFVFATIVQAGLMPAPGEKAPKLRAFTVDGDFLEVNWEGYELTLVNFWATWCVPCINEMPEIQKQFERWSGEGFMVVGVVTDEPGKIEINKVIQKTGVGYLNLVAQTKLKRDWGGIGILPTSYLVDSEGRIVRRYAGGDAGTLELLRTDIDALMQGKPLTTIKFD